MKRLFIAAMMFFSASVAAHSLTDTWWVPQESGWGLTAVHENNLLVITLYVHDAQHRPRWYTAALQRYGNTASGDPEFTGSLYETSGSAIGGPWNPGDVDRRPVGTASFRARPLGRAELEYSVDHIAVVKQIERFTMQQDRLEGLHFATLFPGYDSCPAGFQGLRVFEHGILYIDRCNGECASSTPSSQDRSQIDMVLTDGTREICSIDGAFSRYGRSGGITGSYACIDGGSGTIEFRNIEFTSVGFSARFSANHPQCATFTGILSAVRASAR
jgi:hypothetical protein